MIATATYNVYRAQYAKFLVPEDLMRRSALPQVKPKFRYATPDDVFPSSRPPGSTDTVIDKFDIHAKHLRQKGATFRNG